jgi:hypothetical protein
MSWIAAVIVALAVSAEDAPKPIETEYASARLLGQPCEAYQFLAGAAVYNPATEKELFVLTSSNESRPMSLVFVDSKEQKIVEAQAPSGTGAWALSQLPNPNLLALGTHPDGKVTVFDMEKWAFTASAQFPGESYLWNFAPGKDGRFYFGTYAGAKLGAFDPAGLAADPPTLTLEDCGAPMPPNLYLRLVSNLPDGRILCSFGMQQPGTRIYDPATKQFSEPPAAMAGVAAGVLWNNYFLAGDKVFNAALEPVSPPPFPVPAADKGAWQVAGEVTTADTLFLHQGNALWRLDRDKAELALLYDFDLRGGRLMAASRDGGVFGVRGKLYFHIEPGAAKLERKSLQLDPPSRPPLFLAPDNARNIWGGPPLGQTLFMMNRDNGIGTNTDVVVDSGGQVYGMAFIGEMGFGVSYSNGDIFKLDPNAAWYQYDGKNPVVIASLGARGYIRPVAGMRLGPGNKLYSGWMAQYGVYGGAVAVTDPATGATDLIENPFGKQTVSGLALDDAYIYIGTSLEANGLPAKTGEPPQFGVLGVETRQPLLNQSFEGAATVDRFAVSSIAQRVAFAVDGALRVFNVETMKVMPPFNPAPPRVTSSAIASLGDAFLYYGSEKQVIQFNPVSGEHTVLLELPGAVGAFTGEHAGDLFAACGIDLYRITKKPRS